MAVEITDALIRQIAKLSRLAVSDEELAELASHFRKVLAYVAAFQRLDTTDVDPSIFPLDAANVYREDEVRPSLSAKDALANAPETASGHFVVPRIVGGGSA